MSNRSALWRRKEANEASSLLTNDRLHQSRSRKRPNISNLSATLSNVISVQKVESAGKNNVMLEQIDELSYFSRSLASKKPVLPKKEKPDSSQKSTTKKGHNIQSDILQKMREICAEYGINPRRAPHAVRILLGKDYVPTLSIPKSAKLQWCKRPRDGEDSTLNPIEFFDKYWGDYLDEGILTYRILNDLDESIINAIKGYCRSCGLDSADYLPPSDRKRRPRTTITTSDNIIESPLSEKRECPRGRDR